MIDKTLAPYYIRKRTGVVTIRDFDVGLMNTLGFQVRTVKKTEFEDLSLFEPTFAGLSRGFVNIPGINSSFDSSLNDEVTIVVQYPDFVVTNDMLPAIIITRDTIDFDGTRNFGWEAQYKDAAEGSVKKTIGDFRGFDKVVIKTMAMPIDIFYTIYTFGRFRSQTNLLFHWVMDRFKFVSGIRVKDSLGDSRFYDTVFQGFGEVSEITDVGKRIIGYSIVIIVRGEIDVNPENEYKTMQDYDINFENI